MPSTKKELPSPPLEDFAAAGGALEDGPYIIGPAPRHAILMPKLVLYRTLWWVSRLTF